MQISSFGHSCLLVEEGGSRILIDPGIYSSRQDELTGVDAVFITHEHADHCDIASLKKISTGNPGMVICTNEGVGAVLEKEGIPYEIVGDGERREIKEVVIEGHGVRHATIYHGLAAPKNTGYRIAQRFFHPGDAFVIPESPVEILALPIVAPWSKIEEVLDYALAMKPRICFIIHDGFLQTDNPYHAWAKKILEPADIQVIAPERGRVYSL